MVGARCARNRKAKVQAMPAASGPRGLSHPLYSVRPAPRAWRAPPGPIHLLLRTRHRSAQSEPPGCAVLPSGLAGRGRRRDGSSFHLFKNALLKVETAPASGANVAFSPPPAPWLLVHPKAPNPTPGGGAKLHPQGPHTYFREDRPVTGADPDSEGADPRDPIPCIPFISGRRRGRRWLRTTSGPHFAALSCAPSALPQQVGRQSARRRRHPPPSRETFAASPPISHTTREAQVWVPRPLCQI